MSERASGKASLLSTSGRIGTSGPINATASENPSDAMEAGIKAIGEDAGKLSLADDLSRRMVRDRGLKRGKVRRICVRLRPPLGLGEAHSGRRLSDKGHRPTRAPYRHRR